METDIEKKLIALIADRANVPEDTIKHESTWADLGLDSLDVVELLMHIEDAFGIKIPDNTMTELATVGDALKYIEGLK